jgi:hypothetical protein
LFMVAPLSVGGFMRLCIYNRVVVETKPQIQSSLYLPFVMFSNDRRFIIIQQNKKNTIIGVHLDCSEHVAPILFPLYFLLFRTQKY